jgi:hypothetical protein
MPALTPETEIIFTDQSNENEDDENVYEIN